MISIKKWSQALGFTSTEQKVVVFLTLTFLLGAGVKLFQQHSLPVQQFDYSASDEEFHQQLKTSLPVDSTEQVYTQSRHDSATSQRVKRETKEQLTPKSININRAGKTDLMRLPGVGETTAERILSYRKEKGEFKTIEDLMNVKGIGKKKLERLAPFCTTGR